MKRILLILAFVITALIGVAQTGWSYGNYYQNRGESWTEWRTFFAGYDNNGMRVYRKYCRRTNWYSEERSGYYNRWNGYSWESTWYSGYQWRYSWTEWRVCY